MDNIQDQAPIKENLLRKDNYRTLLIFNILSIVCGFIIIILLQYTSIFTTNKMLIVEFTSSEDKDASSSVLIKNALSKGGILTLNFDNSLQAYELINNINSQHDEFLDKFGTPNEKGSFNTRTVIINFILDNGWEFNSGLMNNIVFTKKSLSLFN